ncbi:DUF3895 domain-containing protein [Virgibacillus dakarensis]|nr:DUF3895 domain-containing protein [Virgibacillus dakarensis]
MTATIYLTQKERDKLLERLTEKQKLFAREFLKRGKRTAFANELAKVKAGSGEDSKEGAIADEWEFVDYIDAGPHWRMNLPLFCECGRSLRYQYIVQNNKTNEIRKFGSTHFQEHTGIPAHMTQAILKGFEQIDYELDEILLKISSGWSLADEGIKGIAPTLELPGDIQRHFDYDMPLLDRQVKRLREIVNAFLMEQARKREEEERIAKEADYARRRQLVASKMKKWNMNTSNPLLQLDDQLQEGVMLYLTNLEQSYVTASEICEELIQFHGAPNDTFSSGRYKVFPHVCSYLESLCEKGILEFMGKRGAIDRVYEVFQL